MLQFLLYTLPLYHKSPSLSLSASLYLSFSMPYRVFLVLLYPFMCWCSSAYCVMLFFISSNSKLFRFCSITKLFKCCHLFFDYWYCCCRLLLLLQFEHTLIPYKVSSSMHKNVCICNPSRSQLNLASIAFAQAIGVHTINQQTAKTKVKISRKIASMLQNVVANYGDGSNI